MPKNKFVTISPYDGNEVNSYYFTNIKKLVQPKKDEISFGNIIKVISKNLKKDKIKIITNTVKESGIPYKYLEEEFDEAIFALNNIKNQADAILKDEKVILPKYKFDSFITYQHKGKVLEILPSSTPLLSAIFLPFVAAVSGNEVVAKISSLSPYIAYYLQKILNKEGYYKIRYALGKGKNYLNELISLKWDMIFFMGGEFYGKQVHMKCVEKNIEFLGEYEGNDWAIILGGNINVIAKEIAKNVVFKSGQDCDSIKGVLINSKDYETFVDLLKNEFKSIKKGNPLEKDTDLGPIYNHKLFIFLKDKFAKKKNNKILDPIILTGDKISKKLIQNPPFASTVWIKKIENNGDILDLYQFNNHGLSVSIYSTNKKEAMNLAAKLNTARVVINSDTLDIHPLIPWGGIKNSSKKGVEYWVEKFVDKKLIEING